MILVQMVWISYSVLTRYGLDALDRMVTEATGLVLFPVAFAGLAYAVREGACPKVATLTGILPAGWRKAAVLNPAIMPEVAPFLSLAGVSATIRF